MFDMWGCMQRLEYLCGQVGQVGQDWKAPNGQFANLRGGETAANSGPLSTQGALLSHPPSSAVREEHGEWNLGSRAKAGLG